MKSLHVRSTTRLLAIIDNHDVTYFYRSDEGIAAWVQETADAIIANTDTNILFVFSVPTTIAQSQKVLEELKETLGVGKPPQRDRKIIVSAYIAGEVIFNRCYDRYRRIN